MTNLQTRQEKIQAKRKQTPFREFLMEIASWKSLMFYKTQGMVSIYPETLRSPKLTHFKTYDDQTSWVWTEFDGSMFHRLNSK